MTTSPEQILAIVEAIQTSSIRNKEEHFALQYANFKTKYPMLYKMACSPEKMDFNNLKYMVSVLSKMEETNMSQYDASARVGQMLYDKYIQDQIKDLPPTKNLP
jgi:hypothetical protein